MNLKLKRSQSKFTVKKTSVPKRTVKKTSKFTVKKTSKFTIKKTSKPKRTVKKTSKFTVKKTSKPKRTVKKTSKPKRTVKRINYKRLSNKKRSCIKNKVAFVMNEFKNKTLKSSAGYRIKNPKQGIAIALSIARKECL